MPPTENLFETFDEAYEFLEHLLEDADDIDDFQWLVFSPTGEWEIDPDEMGFVYIALAGYDDSGNRTFYQIACAHADGITKENAELMDREFELCVPIKNDEN